MNATTKELFEVKTAKEFLKDLDCPVTEVVSLSDFLGTNMSSKFPDVVLNASGHNIGMELTAYSDRESSNRWRSFMNRVHDTVFECEGENYPDLRGTIIAYHPDFRREPKRVTATFVQTFATQLLDFATAMLEEDSLAIGERRYFPDHRDDRYGQLFKDWNLLNEHVSFITVYRSSPETDYPVSVSLGGFTETMGTSVGELVKSIDEKAATLRKHRLRQLNEYWLLIHATGWPISSRIKPLEPGGYVYDELREPDLVAKARSSGFHKVYVWDGIYHGIVELVGLPSLS